MAASVADIPSRGGPRKIPERRGWLYQDRRICIYIGRGNDAQWKLSDVENSIDENCFPNPTGVESKSAILFGRSVRTCRKAVEPAGRQNVVRMICAETSGGGVF